MSCISNISFAQTTVTFGGEVDTQIGVREQSKDYRFDKPQANPRFSKNSLYQETIVNDTSLDLSIDMVDDNGIEFGGEVVLSTDTSLNKYGNSAYDNTGLETYTYIDTNLGRLEGGSTTGVYNDMKISGASVARATGGIDGDVKYWWNPYIFRDGSGAKLNVVINSISPSRLVENHFIHSPNLPSNYDAGGEANASKINYISPAMEGLSFGLSYIHDTAQHGSVKLLHSVSRRIPNYTDVTLGYKQVYSGVIRYSNKFDETTLLASISGEMGRAKFIKSPDTQPFFARHSLGAWEAGVGIEDSGFKLAGSYGDWGKSGVLKKLVHRACNRSDYWTLGGNYEADDTGFSITYFGSRRCGVDSSLGYNAVTDVVGDIEYELKTGTFALGKPKKMEILSFGLDTKLAPGFMPYGELSFFKIEENNGFPTTAELPFTAHQLQGQAHNKRNVGYVLMSGVKVIF